MPFNLDPDADISNTSLVEEVEVIPAELVRALGGPHRLVDPYKVTGLYSFTEGYRIFTVYDWKATSLYQQGLPSPLAFWNSRSKVCLSIGSNCDDVGDFKAWLLNKISGARDPR